MRHAADLPFVSTELVEVVFKNAEKTALNTVAFAEYVTDQSVEWGKPAKNVTTASKKDHAPTITQRVAQQIKETSQQLNPNRNTPELPSRYK